VNRELEAVYNMIQRLRDYGIYVVCCGGAARDYYLGRTPNDYDFVVLNTVHEPETFRRVVELSTNFECRELGDDVEYVNEDRNLAYVFESALGVDVDHRDLKVQFLVYTPAKTLTFKGDPHNVVEDFDCSLNYAWFEEHQGRLLVRVHPEFPSIQYGIKPTHRDGCDERKLYIQHKFPEFY